MKKKTKVKTKSRKLSAIKPKTKTITAASAAQASADSGAKRRMMAQGFQEAQPSDMIRAKREAMGPRPVVIHQRYDGTGKLQVIDAPPKDQFFRTRSEGRPQNVTPKRKKIKTKRQLWNGHTMSNFFRENRILADETTWHIFFNNPARKMTIKDQLLLMMHHSDTEFVVDYSYNDQYLCIDNLTGEDEN